MADRSYLYSTDDLPDSPTWRERKALQGIAEFRADIPLVFKILLTGEPSPCRSSIWDSPDTIALAGDYRLGVAHLTRFLGRITDPAARQVIDESLEFLTAARQTRKYFILECGEIFDLTAGSLAEKNAKLLAELRELGAHLDELPIPRPVDTAQGVLSKLFRMTAPDPLSPYLEMGLDAWSEMLYFDFSQGEP